MTELSMAFGMSGDEEAYYKQETRPKMQTAPLAPPPQSPSLPPPQIQQMNDQPYIPPPTSMYNQQTAASPKYSSSSSTSVSAHDGYDSFWDRLAKKRIDVLKLIVFALVLLLAFSLHAVTNHYLESYITSAFMTPTSEFILRLSYPVAVILVIWIMKAL